MAVPSPEIFSRVNPNRRVMEWSIFAVILAILLAILGAKIRAYQAETEFSAFKFSLGALRTALVLDFLKRHSKGPAANVLQENFPPAPETKKATWGLDLANIVSPQPANVAETSPRKPEGEDKQETSKWSTGNPFQLVETRLFPAYAGESAIKDAGRLQPGSWFYDPECVCVGYVPRFPQHIFSPSYSTVVLMELSRTSDAKTVPTLTPAEPYRWFDESIQ